MSAPCDTFVKWTDKLIQARKQWQASDIHTSGTLTLIGAINPQNVYRPRDDPTILLVYNTGVPANEIERVKVATPCKNCSRKEHFTYHVAKCCS